MGKNNKARRAAKGRDRRRRAKETRRHEGSNPRFSGDPPHEASEPIFTRHELIAGLVDLAPVRLAGGDREFAVAAAERLGRFSHEAVLRVAAGELTYCLTRVWRSGWQPAEVVRQARRHGGAVHVAIVAAAIAAHHAAQRADSIDPCWQQQIDDIVAAGARAPASSRADRWLIDWSAAAELGRHAELMAIFELLAVIRSLPKLDELIPPPGGWTDRDRRARTTPDLPDADRAVLNRVRGLLNKAESTEFEAEAEAFTAKAHELITRHAIDAALLHDDAAPTTDEPIPIRIDIDDPYADAKSLLVQIVAEANRCRAIYHDRISVSTVLGFASDVAATELLYTSLLVQGQAALAAAGRNAPPGARSRSRAYRSAFLVAYANRIGQRLADIHEHLVSESSQGQAALPVLRSREATVDDVFRERFPELRHSAVRGGDDAAGWVGGRDAADRAKLNFGDLADDLAGGAGPTGWGDTGADRSALPAAS